MTLASLTYIVPEAYALLTRNLPRVYTYKCNETSDAGFFADHLLVKGGSVGSWLALLLLFADVVHRGEVNAPLPEGLNTTTF